MKYRAWLLLPAGLLLALPLVPLETGGNPGLWRVLSYAAHYALFGAIAILVYLAIAPGRMEQRARLTIAAGVSGLAALLVELGQGLVARTPSLLDLAVGALGIIVALAGAHLLSRPGPIAGRLAYVVVAALAGLAVLAPAWPEVQAMRWRQDRFPILGAFESEVELRLWRPRHTSAFSTLELSSEHVEAGARSLKVRTAPGSWAGVQYTAGYADWSRHGRLSWALYNPGEPFEVRLRIEDAGPGDYRSGFNRALAVGRGWNRYVLALEEIRTGTASDPLDMERIARMALYTGRDEPSREFFLDDFRLDR